MPSQTGFLALLETPRTATSGALMIGVNAVPPMPPRLEMDIEPPCISASVSFPSRAFAARAAVSCAICSTPFLSQSRTTGTTSPFGVSAAKPRWKYFLSTRLSPSSEALKSGNFFSAATHPFIRNASRVTLIPACSFSLLISTRSASRSVMSASSNCVTCGIITQLRARFAPEIFLMRGSGFTSTGPNFAKSTFGQGGRSRTAPRIDAPPAGADIACFTKPCTSPCRMRPFGPEPGTRERSTPSSRANFRTEGEACAFLNASLSICAGAGAGAGAGAAGASRGGAACSDGAGSAAFVTGGGAGAAAAAADAPFPPAGAAEGALAPSPPAAASSTRMTLPWLTLSPTLTLMSLTVPAAGEGTSIVALSDSSEISGSSAFTASPGLTKTWMIGTSLKSPMSGTLISSVLIAVSGFRRSTARADSPPRRIFG